MDCILYFCFTIRFLTSRIKIF